MGGAVDEETFRGYPPLRSECPPRRFLKDSTLAKAMGRLAAPAAAWYTIFVGVVWFHLCITAAYGEGREKGNSS